MQVSKIIFLLTSTILFTSCIQRDRSVINESKVLKSNTKGYFVLNNAENDTVWYPDLLNINKKYIFHDGEGNSLQVQRIGNMNLKFQLKSGKYLKNFEAQLLPAFYFGMETREADGSEYVIAEYHINHREENCLTSIGIGNQNIAESKRLVTYAILTLKPNCDNPQLTQMKRKLFRLKTIED